MAPSTPASWFAQGTADPAFRTKPQIARAVVDQTSAERWPCRAVIADGRYGEHPGCTAGLPARGVPDVVALKPSPAWWAPVAAIGAVGEVAAAGNWVSAEEPGAWVAVERTCRDGHTTIWWALEGVAGPYGPDRARRLVIAIPDPATLPKAATWYLATTLPVAAADLAEVVRLYGLRHWVAQQDKQVKGSLGWSQDQGRADRVIRRHWALVQGAFAVCWWVDGRSPAPDSAGPSPHDDAPEPPGEPPHQRGGTGGPHAPPSLATALALLASRAAAGARLAGTGRVPVAVLDRVARPAPTTRPASAPGLAAPRPPAPAR